MLLFEMQLHVVTEDTWIEPHPDNGIHFSHLGALMGSLHYGHVAFDMQPSEIRTSIWLHAVFLFRLRSWSAASSVVR